MKLMARICAVWLVALVIAPWTPWIAPFSVCDATRGPLQPHTALDVATVHAVPVVRTAPPVQAMDVVDHPSLWPTPSVFARTIPLPTAIALANSPLVSPLRI